MEEPQQAATAVPEDGGSTPDAPAATQEHTDTQEPAQAPGADAAPQETAAPAAAAADSPGDGKAEPEPGTPVPPPAAEGVRPGTAGSEKAQAFPLGEHAGAEDLASSGSDDDDGPPPLAGLGDGSGDNAGANSAAAADAYPVASDSSHDLTPPATDVEDDEDDEGPPPLAERGGDGGTAAAGADHLPEGGDSPGQAELAANGASDGEYPEDSEYDDDDDDDDGPPPLAPRGSEADFDGGSGGYESGLSDDDDDYDDDDDGPPPLAPRGSEVEFDGDDAGQMPAEDYRESLYDGSEGAGNGAGYVEGGDGEYVDDGGGYGDGYDDGVGGGEYADEGGGDGDGDGDGEYAEHGDAVHQEGAGGSPQADGAAGAADQEGGDGLSAAERVDSIWTANGDSIEVQQAEDGEHDLHDLPEGAEGLHPDDGDGDGAALEDGDVYVDPEYDAEFQEAEAEATDDGLDGEGDVPADGYDDAMLEQEESDTWMVRSGLHAQDSVAEHLGSIRDAKLRKALLDPAMAKHYGASLVHVAAASGDVNVLKQVIDESMSQYDRDAHTYDPRDAAFEVCSLGDSAGRSPLMYAVMADSAHCAKVLLENGADINQEDEEHQTAMHWAAYSCRKSMVDLLLSYGADGTIIDDLGCTFLHWGCLNPAQSVLSAVINYYIACEQSVDPMNFDGLTPLMWAVVHDKPKPVTVLLNNGASPYMCDAEGSTALHICAARTTSKSTACAKALIKRDSKMINACDKQGQVALHRAIAVEHVSMLQLLIKNKATELNVADSSGRTPLHWACALGHVKLTECLLDGGADDSKVDTHGATSLHYAAQRSHLDCLKRLLKNAPDAVTSDVADDHGRHALVWAVAKENIDACTELLKASLPSLTTCDDQGQNVLHVAADIGNVGLVELLLEHGIDINVVDSLGHSAMSDAVEAGHLNVVEKLVEKGAQVNDRDVEGRNSLHWTAINGKLDIMQVLLKTEMSGGKLEEKDERGETALHYAVFFGQLECTKLLLDAGSLVNALDNDGVTPLHWAAMKGHTSILQLLIQEPYKADVNFMDQSDGRSTALDYALQEYEGNPDNPSYQECIAILTSNRAVTSFDIYSSVAVVMQSRWRARAARKVFERAKEAHGQELEAATVLKRVFRGFVQRKRFLQQKCAASQIQKRWRRHSVASEDRMVRAITILQKSVRGWMSRKVTNKKLAFRRRKKQEHMYKSSDEYQNKVKRQRKLAEEKKRAANALKAVQDAARARELAMQSKRDRAVQAAKTFETKNKDKMSAVLQKSTSKAKERKRLEDDVQAALLRRGRRQLERLAAANVMHRTRNSEEKGLAPKAGVAARTLKGVNRHMQQYWAAQLCRRPRSLLREMTGWPGDADGDTAADAGPATAEEPAAMTRSLSFSGSEREDRVERLVARLAMPSKQAIRHRFGITETPAQVRPLKETMEQIRVDARNKARLRRSRRDFAKANGGGGGSGLGAVGAPRQLGAVRSNSNSSVSAPEQTVHGQQIRREHPGVFRLNPLIDSTRVSLLAQRRQRPDSSNYGMRDIERLNISRGRKRFEAYLADQKTATPSVNTHAPQSRSLASEAPPTATDLLAKIEV